jgi:hypothetical protein
LRVAGAAIEMLKGTRKETVNVPVPHSTGPVYYRNSFEKRTTPYNYVNNVAQNTGTFNLDPCFYNPAVLANSNVTNPVCEIQQTNPRSGLYSVKTTGSVGSNVKATYTFKIADTKIAVKPSMSLSFWKKTENESGRFVFVDLISKSGKKLSTSGYNDQNGTSMNPAVAHGTTGVGWEKFTCNFGNGVLLGDTIAGIVFTYENTGAGPYSAFFDDFLIETDGTTSAAARTAESTGHAISVFPNPSDGRFNLKFNLPGEYRVMVYNSSGTVLIDRMSDNTSEIIDLTGYSAGIYLLRTISDKKNVTSKILINNKMQR